MEKQAVAAKLLTAIASLNRFWFSFCDLCGRDCENDDFDEGITTIKELVFEMYDYLPARVEKEISVLQTENEAERLLQYLM